MSPLADLIQRYYDVFNKRDIAAYDRLFTPDCLVEAPGVELRGVEGARAFDKVWLTALPDATIVNLHRTETGKVVMCENRLRGTHTGPLVTADGTLAPSGARFDARYAAVFELDGERIARQTLHFDRVQVVRVLGGDVAGRHIAAARGIYEAFGRRDMAAILDALADDVTWGIDSIATEVPPYGILRGKREVPRFFAAWAESAEFTRFEPTDFVAAGEHVFNTLRYEVVVKATGKRVASSSAQQWTFDGSGKIARWRGWEDTAALRDAFRR